MSEMSEPQFQFQCLRCTKNAIWKESVSGSSVPTSFSILVLHCHLDFIMWILTSFEVILHCQPHYQFWHSVSNLIPSSSTPLAASLPIFFNLQNGLWIFQRVRDIHNWTSYWLPWRLLWNSIDRGSLEQYLLSALSKCLRSASSVLGICASVKI